MTDDRPQLLRLRQLARRFGLSSIWLREEAEAGRIPCLRAGRTLLFDADAVEAALLARARQAPTDPPRATEGAAPLDHKQTESRGEVSRRTG